MSSVGGPTDVSAKPGIQPQALQPEQFEEVKQILSNYITVSHAKAEELKALGWTGAEKKPSLEKPVLNIEDMTRALMEIQTKLQDEQIKFSKEDIKVAMEKKKGLHEERLQKIRESIDKMAEAKKAGVFGKVFGWIATAVMCVAAVAMACTGVGAVASAMMITGAALMLTMQIASETGLMDYLADKWGSEAVLGLQIALTVASIALSLGAGAFAAPAAAASTSAQVAARVVAQVARIVGGIATMGAGAAGIGTAVKMKDAEDARADSMDIIAFMKKLQMMVEDEMKRVQEVLRKMQEGVDVVMQILSGQIDTKSFLIQQQGV